MIKAVFFDLYNTLIRYDPSREDIHVMVLKDLQTGLKPEMFSRPLAVADEYLYQEMAIKPWSRMSENEKQSRVEEFERIVLRGIGLEPSEELIRRVLETSRRLKSRMLVYEDVVPTFTALRERGLKIGLVSNAERIAYRLIDELDLKKWLDIVVTSDETGFIKPDPRIFEAALERGGVTAGDSLYVGDQYRIDIIGARNAGIKGILIDRAGFSDHIADCPVIRRLPDLIRYL